MKKTIIVGLGALMALSCYAVTPPTLFISDGTNSILLDQTGTCSVVSGTANCGSISVSAGDLVLNGATLGSPIDVGGITAACKTLPTYPGSDLLFTASGDVTVTANCSDTGYTQVGTVTLIGGSSGSTFEGFVNPANVVCTTLTCPGQALGPVTNGGTFTGAIVTSPYALTTQVMFALGSLPGGGGELGGDFNITVVPNSATGCPATPGFWKHHAYPTTLIFPVTLGGVQYSPSEFNAILNSPGGGNAVDILGFQLVAAVLNVAAGGKTNNAVMNAIATAQSLLQTGNGLAGATSFPLTMPTSYVSPGSPLGMAMINVAATLASYNTGFFNTCTDGTGLLIG